MYLFYYLFIIFLSFFYDLARLKVVKNILLLIIFLFTVLFVGLRSSNIGTDTNSYIYMLENLDLYNFYTMEPLFFFYSSIIDFFLNGEFKYLVYFTLISLITWFFFYKGIIDNGFLICLSVSVVFSQTNIFYDQFNTIRQLIAISIIFFSFKYLLNFQYRKYFIFCFLASLFHYSAFISILFFILFYFRSYFIYFIFFIPVLFYGFFKYLFGFLVGLNSKYNAYIDSGIDIDFLGKGALLSNVLILGLLVFFIKYINSKLIDRYKFFLGVVIIGFFLQLIINYYSIGGLGAIRVTYYFNLGYIFIFNYIYLSFKGDYRLLFLLVSLFVFSIKFLYMLQNTTLPDYSILNYQLF